VTNASPEVASYPFTTQQPQPAMMAFENIQIQLVDTPAVSAEYMPSWLPNLIRYADVACLLADAGNDACLENVEAVLNVLFERNVKLVRSVSAEATVLSRVAEVPAVVIATKMDRDGAGERLEILREFFGERFDILTCSANRALNLDELRQHLFARLGIIRVCTKVPGKPPDEGHPFVLPVGSTVLDLARHIHKDMHENMRFARIWGAGKFDGQKVPRDHVLSDMDILEINA